LVVAAQWMVSARATGHRHCATHNVSHGRYITSNSLRRAFWLTFLTVHCPELSAPSYRQPWLGSRVWPISSPLLPKIGPHALDCNGWSVATVLHAEADDVRCLLLLVLLLPSPALAQT
jgi:hypothetical protein